MEFVPLHSLGEPLLFGILFLYLDGVMALSVPQDCDDVGLASASLRPLQDSGVGEVS